jgi:hypothetical protein
MRPLLLLLLLLLPACGATSAGSAAPDGSPAQDALAAAGRGELTVEVDLGDGSAVQSWTLTCDGAVGGSHPRAEAACAHLQSLEAPFAPLRADAVCTEIYGGPQTARVLGQWKGEPVDLELARSNGCLMSQWDGLVPLVPAAT